MRLPYVPNPPPTTSEEDRKIVDAITLRRQPWGLQALDLALFHSPPIASGWSAFLGAIRTGSTLSHRIREIAICRVAVMNKAGYEWHHHAPIAKKVGVSQEAIVVLSRGEKRPEGGEAQALTEQEWAVVAFADESTRDVTVEDETMKSLRRFFSDKEVVEIAATVAAYNCVSRFLVALDVGEMNGHPISPEGLYTLP